ncbi:MAG: tRNA (adenosine(37)-N6)-threonylcarbamoyltransferase complex ATPase subunit type 1 TsaE [bacterium]|nr:tRNA (adenosine(37)-N6)-threonylcarbamoyltransferase complex ATPase subunit type 1 TsaE [bacterium]
MNNDEMKHYLSISSAKTKALGTALAKKILRSKKIKKNATVVALQGDLGAGKTTFVQGFMRGMGHRGRVMSPTFILFRRLALRHKRFANVYHVDAYRVRNPKEFSALGFKEIVKDPANIILVEWPERLGRMLPRHTIKISFEHGENMDERKISH